MPKIKFAKSQATRPSSRDHKFKYAVMSDARNDITADFLSGKLPTELWEKYKTLIQSPPTRCSFMTIITHNKKWALNRRKGEAATRLAKQKVDAIQKIVIDRVAEGAKRHFERMDEFLIKAGDVIDKKNVTNGSLSFDLDTVSRYDTLARKTFKIDDDSKPNQQQFNIAILMANDDPPRVNVVEG